MSVQRRQRGLTLLEILLVLALLVIIGAIAAPAIGRFAMSQKLRDSANLIRGEFTRARVQAMKSGRIHVFRYEQEGTQYSVDFWMADDDALEGGDDSAAAGDVTMGNSAATAWNAKEIPDGVRFLFGETQTNARDASAQAEIGVEADAAGAGWSAPILFYSDGTTSSAEVVLANNRNDAIRISLRGLTGIATVSEVFRVSGPVEGGAP